MSRQDKATTERHAKILRELVKKPENKMCADCKRNDARWASWNIGVFVCIRCSGIHRSMGTHISRVKSVDLDVWDVKQMESIQKWGNHRANLYWEAHLKPGHIPPEHKMESFIRSKYETRRWAREGLPPDDPSTLEEGGSSLPSSTPTTKEPPPTPKIAPTSRPLSPPRTSRHPQSHQLLSTATAGRAAVAPPVQAPAQVQQPAVHQQPQVKTAQEDLFSLDFHSPSPATGVRDSSVDIPKKDVKQDILSLFSTPAPGGRANPSVQPQADAFGVWGAAQQQQQQQGPQQVSMVGSNGTGMWGVQSGWNAPAVQSPPAFPAQQNANAWGWNASAQSPPAQPSKPAPQGIFESQSIWGSSAIPQQSNGLGATSASGDLFGNSFSSSTTAAPAAKKDDVFGDIWGDFK